MIEWIEVEDRSGNVLRRYCTPQAVRAIERLIAHGYPVIGGADVLRAYDREGMPVEPPSNCKEDS
ncbi:MAG: hypothetical protein ACRDLD_02410 [Thermoleophilaceae bacterium]